jgi:hypothetical protein
LKFRIAAYVVTLLACAVLVGCGPAARGGSQAATTPDSSDTSDTATVAAIPQGGIPASKTSWSGPFGSDHGQPETGYFLLGQGFLRGEMDDEVIEIVPAWFKAHPRARVIPVFDWGTSPDGTKSFWVWVVDGDEYLNHYLVSQGVCPANAMRRPQGDLPLLVTQDQYDAFVGPLPTLEASAKQSHLGIWK